MKDIKLTQEGYDNLVKELENLENVEKPLIAKLLKEAIEQGDLSENDAYTQAKDRQARTEMRVREIKETLKRAEIVKKSTGSTINVGSTIKTKTSDGAEREFIICDKVSADPAQNKISYDSPLGKAFMSHKKGDKVEVDTPAGTKQYTILEVN